MVTGSIQPNQLCIQKGEQQLEGVRHDESYRKRSRKHPRPAAAVAAAEAAAAAGMRAY